MHRLLKLRYYAAKWIRTWRAIDARRLELQRQQQEACAHEVRMRGGVPPSVVCGDCGATLEEAMPIADYERLQRAIVEVPPQHAMSLNITHVALTERGYELGGTRQVIQSRVHAADVTQHVLDGTLKP